MRLRQALATTLVSLFAVVGLAVVLGIQSRRSPLTGGIPSPG